MHVEVIDFLVAFVVLALCGFLFAFDRRRPLALRALLSSHGLWWCAAYWWAQHLSLTSQHFRPVTVNPGWQIWYALLAIGVAIAVADLFLYRGPKKALSVYLLSAVLGFVLYFDGAVAIMHDGP